MRSVRSARRDLPDAVVTGRFKRFDAVGCSDRIEEVRIWGRGGRCLSAPLSWGVAMAERMAGACNRIVQKARVRKDGWTITRRRKFLNALGETCNVRHACEVAGLSQRSAYDLRQRDVTFARLWAEALTLGYETLEAALLSHALIGVNAIAIGAPIEGEEPVTVIPGTGFDPRSLNPASVQLALTLLNRHRQAVDSKPTSPRGKRATPDETNAALRKQLDMMARKLNSGKSEGNA